jgi:outer membrane protein TolC
LGGGEVDLLFNNSKLVTNNGFANYNPTMNTNFGVTYTQPLMRGFTIDGTAQQLKVTAINRDISEIQLKGTLATTVANVRNAYWELVYGVQGVEVAKGSLDLAQKLVEDNRARVEVGTMAPLDVVQSEAEAATRRQALAQAEATLRTSELALKRLIVNGTEDPLWRASISPVDRPEFRPQPLDVEAAVTRALNGRTDLDQARKTLTSNDITIKFLKNQTMPGIDLVSNYLAQGLGGTQYLRPNLGAPATGTIPGGFSDAFRTMFARDYPTWSFQMNFSYPLGSSPAGSQLRPGRASNVDQTAPQIRALELSVATDVTNSAVQVESISRATRPRRGARTGADPAASGTVGRFEVGPVDNFFVVAGPARPGPPRRTWSCGALLDYRQALVEYERRRSAARPPDGGSGRYQQHLARSDRGAFATGI